jgi:hypothetical protein
LLAAAPLQQVWYNAAIESATTNPVVTALRHSKVRRKQTMMKSLVAILAVTVLLAACSTPVPSVPQANQAACAAIATYYQSVGAFNQLGATATVAEYKTAATAVQTAFAGVQSAMLTVTDAKIDDVQTAATELQTAVTSIPDTATAAEAKATMATSVTSLQTAVQALNDNLKCGVLPTVAAGQ